MPKIAVMEDDPPTSKNHVAWISEGVSSAEVFRYETLEQCEAALRERSFDLIVLDIALGIRRNAGIELMRQIDHLEPAPPVLVVSGLAQDQYRGVTKALGAWDFLPKPCQSHDLVEAVLEVLSEAGNRPRFDAANIKFDPENQTYAWKGKRLNLTLTHLRILNLLIRGKGEPVPYAKLYEVVRTGKTELNIRKHISDIRTAFKEVDPEFASIKVISQFGFVWIER